MRQEAQSLLADARRLEAQAVGQILDAASVSAPRSPGSTASCSATGASTCW